MIADNSRSQISEQSSKKTEKWNSSKDQAVLKKTLDEFKIFQIEDEDKNVLVMIINLLINSGNAKAVVRHPWKDVELHEQH
jgi:hypothetical protein